MDDARTSTQSPSAEPTSPAQGDNEQTGVIRGRVTLKAPHALVKPRRNRTVVYVKSDHDQIAPGSSTDKQPPPIPERPYIAQRNKSFEPNFLIIKRGTYVEFPNWDPFSHNVFTRSKVAPPFDLGRYPKGIAKTDRFNTVGRVQLFCNIHPQMHAELRVVPNGYYDRVDSHGRFMIEGIPTGEHTVVVWHAQLGKVTRAVQVTASKAARLSVTLKRQQDRWFQRGRREDKSYEGVKRGLGVKRDQLNLPVIEEAHPARPKRPSEAKPDEGSH
jgi:hypothetical protein